MRDYAAAGLQGKIPLWGSGFLTEGVIQAAGPAAEGVMTTAHYADSLDTPRNNQFRAAYAGQFKLQPDVYAVQGYDAGQLRCCAAPTRSRATCRTRPRCTRPWKRPSSTARAASGP